SKFSSGAAVGAVLAPAADEFVDGYSIAGKRGTSNSMRLNRLTISEVDNNSYPGRIKLGGREYNTAEYGKIVENEFKDVRAEPLSTFSIDVDGASYSNVRRFIMTGQMPPTDAVRVEEMVNYFRYEYPQPTDGHPFSITT